ncbi:four helix bundle protein [Reichenbachiella sp.]|uniref:four helix bundle protein n=1 Tax=Reichenbachiella sp. TaxID=2184521 RepID=UPI003B5ABC67
MTEIKKYDLEDRTYEFAKKVRFEMRNIKTSIYNMDDIKQVLRASGSVGANYIEANEGLSPKDFRFRAKICRKEAKESAYWLKLLFETDDLKNQNKVEKLHQEAIELKKIFSAMIRNSKD